MAYIKPVTCWSCGQKNTMTLVKDSHQMKFYQCQKCFATDNGDPPEKKE